jgi:hypothetical protein
MVKPPLRTKSIGFKVSEEEYAQLEMAAQADGRTLGEWCREVILRRGSASNDPALAEIVGVRLLLVNVLRPLAAGEKLAPEAFDKMLDQISEAKHQLAAKLQQAARKKPQRDVIILFPDLLRLRCFDQAGYPRRSRLLYLTPKPDDLLPLGIIILVTAILYGR